MWSVIASTLGNSNFFFGVAAMAVAFFSLLFALSWGDVSLVAPAAASLTFIGNAFAAKVFLHEKVDRLVENSYQTAINTQKLLTSMDRRT